MKPTSSLSFMKAFYRQHRPLLIPVVLLAHGRYPVTGNPVPGAQRCVGKPSPVDVTPAIVRALLQVEHITTRKFNSKA